MINNSRTAVQIKTTDEDRWIDIHDDALMIGLGLRPDFYQGRSESVWSKTPEERKQLVQLKARCTTILPQGWPESEKRYPLYADLIVRIRPSNKFQIYDKKSGHNQKKTTFSHKRINVVDIPKILEKYYVWKKDIGRQSLVIFYIWNGKKYSPGEIPNVRWK